MMMMFLLLLYTGGGLRLFLPLEAFPFKINNMYLCRIPFLEYIQSKSNYPVQLAYSRICRVHNFHIEMFAMNIMYAI